MNKISNQYTDVIETILESSFNLASKMDKALPVLGTVKKTIMTGDLLLA